MFFQDWWGDLERREHFCFERGDHLSSIQTRGRQREHWQPGTKARPKNCKYLQLCIQRFFLFSTDTTYTLALLQVEKHIIDQQQLQHASPSPHQTADPPGQVTGAGASGPSDPASSSGAGGKPASGSTQSGRPRPSSHANNTRFVPSLLLDLTCVLHWYPSIIPFRTKNGMVQK